jgi:ribosomal protein S12 methylthiotransferase
VRIFLLSLGCAKNTADSEVLVGMLEAAGHTLVATAEEADVAFVNTCGFIQPAVEESIGAILDLEQLKEDGRLRKIGVLGCLFNRYGEDLKKEIPSVDIWARAEDWSSLLRALGSPECAFSRGRLPETKKWTRYLKIGEGCDNTCAYCTIPSIRGRSRSVPVASVVAQAEDLVESGARELCLVGQDLTSYGRDLDGKAGLPDLLAALESAVPEDVWIRLLYLHPARMDEAFIDRLLSFRRVQRYLDIPIQHIDDEILRRMRRPGNSSHIRRLFSYARQADPLFTLRTTLIVGFPGESEAAFAGLLDFLGEMSIDRVGAFVFSPEEGTPAATMDGQIPDAVRERRYARLMELQSGISLERQRLFEGKTMRVLLEEIDVEGGLAWGRSYRDAPEVDGLVGVSPAAGLREGEFVSVSIAEAEEYDLFGVPADDVSAT